MKLFAKKAIILLLCIPFYPLVIFAEWYDKKTHFGPKFNLRKATADYWADVRDTLTYREGR